MTLRITTIGGGTGQPPILVGLMKLFHDLDIELNSIVGTWDSGGSSGKLRDLYGVMPPGDILKNIMALTPPENRNIAESLLRRFDKTIPRLYNHNAGNMLLTSLEKHSGAMQAIRALETVVGAMGCVWPVTECDTDLYAEMTRVKSVIVDNEAEIETRLDSNYKISKLWLEPCPKSYPALKPLEKTDVLIISPGSIFTSIIPHFTLKEIQEACGKIKTRILIANLVDKRFTTREYMDSIRIWLGIKPTHMIFNSMIIANDKYANAGYKQIFIDGDHDYDGMHLISRPVMKTDKKLVRHDPKRTAAAIMEVLSKEKIL